MQLSVQAKELRRGDVLAESGATVLAMSFADNEVRVVVTGSGPRGEEAKHMPAWESVEIERVVESAVGLRVPALMPPLGRPMVLADREKVLAALRPFARTASVIAVEAFGLPANEIGMVQVRGARFQLVALVADGLAEPEKMGAGWGWKLAPEPRVGLMRFERPAPIAFERPRAGLVRLPSTGRVQ